MKKMSLLALGLSLSLLGTILVFPMGAAAADTTYTFGVADFDSAEATMTPPPLFNKQGLNNFYAFYSLQNNVGGKAKEAALKECEFAVNKNSYAMKTMVPKADDVNNYLNNVWPQLYPGQNPQFWWKISSLGIVAPAGNMVAVVGFKAPADGSYAIKAECYGGAKDDQGSVSDKADGVSFAVMNKDACLWSQSTGKAYKNASNPYKVPEKTLQMSKDEFVYFTVDPNSTFENDLGHWYIIMTQKAETNPTSSKDNSSTASNSNGQTGKTDTNSIAASTPSLTDESQPMADGEQNSSLSETASDDIDSSTVTIKANSTETLAKVNNGEQSAESHVWIIWLIVVLVLAAGGGFTAFYFIKKKQGIDLFKKK